MKTWGGWTCSWIALVVVGCGGGSGSSGFDALAGAESAAIERALGGEQCVPVEGRTLIVCPLSTMAVPEAVPVQVALLDGESSRLDCGIVAESDCSISLSFSFAGTGAEADNIRLALRSFSAVSAWFVGEAAPVPIGMGQYLGSVRLPAAVLGGVSEVQLAVLVFEEAPPAFPGGLHLLSQAGARYAFVAQPMRRPEAR